MPSPFKTGTNFATSPTPQSLNDSKFESKKLKGRTESYFILFLKLNDHQTRCLNLELRRNHPNGCKFELNQINSNLRQTLLRIKINTMKGSFSHLNFRPLRTSPTYEHQVNKDAIYKKKSSVHKRETYVCTVCVSVVPLPRKEQKYLCSF